MFDYLVDHALKNVWCTPDQDLQAIVKPARLTSPSGAFSTVEVLWRTHQLPVRGVRFHVYQIGQLHPLLMGLFPVSKQWVTLADACTKQNLITDVYDAKGVQLPRCEVWYQVTADKNLILAVKEQKNIPIDLTKEDIFFRVYSNAYFNSTRADKATDVVVVKGKTCLTTNDILGLQNEFNTWKTKGGHTTAFINGYKVAGIDLIAGKVGDVIEFVYDSSIYKVVDFKIGSLATFNSELDVKRKYLLHHTQTELNNIDYQDDIDAFLLKTDANGRHKGVFYHRNQPDAMRMVTHRDYSVPVAYLAGFATHQGEDWVNTMGQLVLRLHLRKSGYRRPLVNEHNRIKELYKLPHADIRKALLGLDSVVENWRAEKLEKAAYVEIMRSKASQITHAKMQDAYGYNAISKLIADTPMFTREFSGQRIIDVPYGLQTRAVGYEYDSEGYLLGVFSHATGATYAARDIRTKLVELIAGAGDDRLDEVYGQKETTLDPNANYRMYLCPIEAGVVTNKWADVTGSGKYAMTGNKLTWLVDMTKWYPCVRSDKVFLSYNLDLGMTDGLLKFSLTHRQSRNSVLSMYVMQIPMGELDVFLNGRSLIEGIDYIVRFPEIVIFNKEYLVNPKTQQQKLHIRFCGFANTDFTRDVPDDYGFVDYNLLSQNNRFDIRDDKVMRIVVDGKLYDRSELKFAEEHSGVSVHERNGSPYMIRDIVVPMRGLTQENTYSLREKSRAVDKVISDYMTLKLPEPAKTGPSAIPALYQLVSPFACKILHDLKAGILDDPRLKEHYNDQDVQEIVKPYLPLLKYDPTQEGQEVDSKYTVIHPHHLNEVMEIDIYYYKFLMRVNKLFLHNKVQMAHTLKLAPAA